MPVIIKPDDACFWLDEGINDTEVIRPLLRPVEEDYLEDWPVSTAVNSPANNDERCIERRIGDADPGSLFSHAQRR